MAETGTRRCRNNSASAQEVLKRGWQGLFSAAAGSEADVTVFVSIKASSPVNKSDLVFSIKSVKGNPSNKIMRSAISKSIYVLLALALSACAGQPIYLPTGRLFAGATSSAVQVRGVPIASGSPSQIVVFPFATSSSEVTLNQGIGARLYRNWSGEDQTATQAQLARSTAQDICVHVATSLANKGWNAACQPRGKPLAGANVLIIDGAFTDINEGNRLQRMVIGLGVGASVVDTQVGLYQYSNGNSTQLITFSTHADSGRMPGAGITGPAGAAAGATTAATIGVNVAAGGIKTITSSTGYLTQQSAKQVVDQSNNYFLQRGWKPTTPVLESWAVGEKPESGPRVRIPSSPLAVAEPGARR
jgi:hypothetical protein